MMVLGSARRHKQLCTHNISYLLKPRCVHKRYIVRSHQKILDMDVMQIPLLYGLFCSPPLPSLEAHRCMHAFPPIQLLR